MFSSLTTESGTERIEAVSVAGGNGRWSSSTRTSGDIFLMSVSGKFEPKALLATPAFEGGAPADDQLVPQITVPRLFGRNNLRFVPQLWPPASL